MPGVNRSNNQPNSSSKKSHNYETENFWLDKYKYLEAKEFYAVGNSFFQRIVAGANDSSTASRMDQFMKRFDQLEREQKSMQQQLNQMSSGILQQLAAIQKQLGMKPDISQSNVNGSAPLTNAVPASNNVTAVSTPNVSNSVNAAAKPSPSPAPAPDAQAKPSVSQAPTAAAVKTSIMTPASAAPTSIAVPPAKSTVAVTTADSEAATNDAATENGAAKKKRRKKPNKGFAGAAGDVAETNNETKANVQQQQPPQPTQQPAQQPQQAQKQQQQQKSQQAQKSQKSQQPQQQQAQQGQKSQQQKQQPAGAAAAKKPDTKGDDDIDLFGSDEEVETEEAKRIREERLKQYAQKKSAKPALIAKSNVILDVKPWDDETDMKKLEVAVRSVVMDGLLWGQSKLVDLAYGIKKLQISCVVEDDKVSIEELAEKLQEFEDFVQSVDIAAFNKI